MGETKKLSLKKEDGMREAVSKEAPKKDVARKDQAQENRVEQIKKFLRGVKSELKKVHWPDRPTVITFTGVVLVSVFFVALLIWIVDTGLGYLLELILKR